MNNALKILAAVLVVWAFFLARETVLLRNAPYEQAAMAANPALRPCITREVAEAQAKAREAEDVAASRRSSARPPFVNPYSPDFRPICPAPWYSRALDWIR